MCMNRRYCGLLGALGPMLILNQPLNAAVYAFTKIADNSTGYSTFGNPSINDSGAVVFYAEVPPGFTSHGGIRRGPNPATDTIADTSGPYRSMQAQPVINNAGVVVFTASLDSGADGIFRGPNPATDTIVDST